MSQRRRFPTEGELWRSVVRVFSPELDPLLVVAGFIAILFVGVLINAVYGWIVAWGQKTIGADPSLLIALSLLFVTIVTVLTWRFYRLRGRGEAMLVESSPAPHQGLIYLLSFQIDTGMVAFRHHSARLKHCWVVYTKDDASLRSVYEGLVRQVNDAGISVEWHPVEIAADPVTKKAGTKAVYEAVRAILTGDLPDGLAPTQIITDITGGTRPISAGAALACAILERSLEYVDSDYDPLTNKPIKGSQRVIAVEWK